MRESAALPLLLTVAETAEILRTTRKAVYAMIERGQLPGVTRLGRRVLIRSEDLLRWLDHKRTPSFGAENKSLGVHNFSTQTRITNLVSLFWQELGARSCA